MKIQIPRKVVFITAAICMAGISYAQDRAEFGTFEYTGSGYAERAPEFGTLTIKFKVDCLASREEVVSAITEQSAAVWAAIQEKVPSDVINGESLNRSFGSVQDIVGRDGSAFYTPEGENLKKRRDVCTGAPLPLNKPAPTIFSGNQTLAVSTTDMDWLEGLYDRLSKYRPNENDPKAVKLSLGKGISYLITEATQAEMKAEALANARADAIGPESKFEDDKENLHFEHVRYRGRRIASPGREFLPTYEAPVERGVAPKVSSKRTYYYTVYARSPQIKGYATKDSSGFSTHGQVVGEGAIRADYARTTITVSTDCHSGENAPAKAKAAVDAATDELLKELRAFNGEKDSETDRLTNNEASPPLVSAPYEIVEWNNVSVSRDDRGGIITRIVPLKWLDLCSYEIIDAGPDGDHPNALYYGSRRTLKLRSSDFEGILNLVQRIQTQNLVASTDTDRIKIVAIDPVAAITTESKGKLDRLVRHQASSCLLDGGSSLNQEAKSEGFTCAHLIRFSLTPPPEPHDDQGLSRRFVRRTPDARFEAGLDDAGVIDKGEIKPSSERVKQKLQLTYVFTMEAKTGNLIEKLSEKLIK